MTQSKILFAALGLSLLTACASTPATAPAPAPLPKDDAPASIVQLSPRTLSPGECGLFLFTRESPRRFILFSLAGSNIANVIIDGTEVSVPLTSVGGDIFGQFLTSQTFSDETVSIQLNLTPGDIIQDGQRIPVASLIHRTSEDWDVITPLQGVRACKPDKVSD